MSRDDVDTKEDPSPRPAADDDDGRELDQQIAQYLRLGLPAATLICAVVAGVLQGAAAVILVLAAGALVSVIALFWASIRTLVGETALSGADAYALGAPRAEEEQKRAVLRALKDLEFERSVGKISDEDYAALVSKYRGEAKRLIRSLDEDAQPRRDKVESLVRSRLIDEGLLDPTERPPEEVPPDDYREAAPAKKQKGKAKAAPAKASEAKPTKQAGETPKPASPPKDEEAKPATGGPCASCGTRNDADAAFCKKCGAHLEEDEEEDEPEADEPSREKTS